MIRTEEDLNELLESKQFYPYVEQAGNDAHPDARWDVLGDVRNDLLWLVLTNIKTGKKAIECIQSPVVSPPMIDRMFGIDVSDNSAASHHSGEMWDRCKKELFDCD